MFWTIFRYILVWRQNTIAPQIRRFPNRSTFRTARYPREGKRQPGELKLDTYPTSKLISFQSKNLFLVALEQFGGYLEENNRVQLNLSVINDQCNASLVVWQSLFSTLCFSHETFHRLPYKQRFNLWCPITRMTNQTICENKFIAKFSLVC